MASEAGETLAEDPKPPAAAAAVPMVGPYSQALAEGTKNKKGDNLDLWPTLPLNAGMLTVALAVYGGVAEDIIKSGVFCRETKHRENNSSNSNGTSARTSTTSYYYVTDPGSKPLPYA